MKFRKGVAQGSKLQGQGTRAHTTHLLLALGHGRMIRHFLEGTGDRALTLVIGVLRALTMTMSSDAAPRRSYAAESPAEQVTAYTAQVEKGVRLLLKLQLGCQRSLQSTHRAVRYVGEWHNVDVGHATTGVSHNTTGKAVGPRNPQCIIFALVVNPVPMLREIVSSHLYLCSCHGGLDGALSLQQQVLGGQLA